MFWKSSTILLYHDFHHFQTGPYNIHAVAEATSFNDGIFLELIQVRMPHITMQI